MLAGLVALAWVFGLDSHRAITSSRAGSGLQVTLQAGW
jgi:hypothetical protein